MTSGTRKPVLARCAGEAAHLICARAAVLAGIIRDTVVNVCLTVGARVARRARARVGVDAVAASAAVLARIRATLVDVRTGGSARVPMVACGGCARRARRTLSARPIRESRTTRLATITQIVVGIEKVSIT